MEEMEQPKNTHSVIPFPKIRKATISLLKAAKRKNMIHSLIEVDIANAREGLKQLKKEKKGFVSFTGYVVYCVAKAVDENKYLHACRNRKNQLVLFDNVDISTTIERKIDQNNEVVAMIVRSANHKTIIQISEEIRNEKNQQVEQAEVFRSMRLFLSLPGFFRQTIFRLLDRSPRMMKKRAGTVMVTSANMIGEGAGWGLPIASHTLNITIGSIVRRIVEIEGQFESRPHLCMTVSIDHDIVDGAPAARFIRRLKKIMEGSIG